MSSLTDRQMAPKVSEATLARLQGFADVGADMGITPPIETSTNTYTFGEGQSAQMARMSGMHAVDDSFNNENISKENLSPEERAEKRRKEIMQKFMTMGIVDQLIQKIDIRLEEIGNEITKLQQDNLQIGIRRDQLSIEAEQIGEELERRIEAKILAEAETPEVEQAVIDAERAQAEALLEQERARKAMISAVTPEEVAHSAQATKAADERVELTTEELELRREQAMNHVTNLQELDQGIDHLNNRLKEITVELEGLDVQEARNNASIEELKIEQQQLLEARDKLQNDPEFRAKVESGEYTVQQVMDELPPAAQETFSQQLDGWITSATDAAWNAWAGVKDMANSALETVTDLASDAVETVTSVTNDAVEGITHTASDAANSVITAASDTFSSLKMTISGILVDEPEPTGDRAPANAAPGELKAVPPTSQLAFNAATVEPGVKPDVEYTPTATPAPAYAQNAM